MHFAFIDIADSYTADRPDEDAPFGGTNTAVVFTARALQKAGNQVTIFNKIREPTSAHGIWSLPLECLPEECLKPHYSVFVFCGRWVKWLVEVVQEKAKVPIVAWMHESTFNADIVPLLPSFHGFVFVSEWQRGINKPLLPPSLRTTIIRNAMNPAFANMFQSDQSILAAKTAPPVIIYSGATPRGVLHIPAILKELRKLRSNFTVEIYCRCSPSQDPSQNAAFQGVIKAMPNVTHVGQVSQKILAAAMKRASVLLSPNTWPETSCITVIEAMAAGLHVVTTNRAVLPETAQGYATHIQVEDANHPTRFDIPLSADLFAATIHAFLENRQKSPTAFEDRLRDQVTTFNAAYRWETRVGPWTEFVSSFGSL